MTLLEKAKTLVEKSPSQIGEPFIHLKLWCVCCGRKFFEGDIREEPDKVTGKEKPLCKNCSKHGEFVREKLHSDAQQEIDKLKHFEDLYIKNIQRLEKERGEWKQKLQQLWNEKPTILEIMLTTKRQSLKDFVSEEIDWRMKLHKLLEGLLE